MTNSNEFYLEQLPAGNNAETSEQKKSNLGDTAEPVSKTDSNHSSSSGYGSSKQTDLRHTGETMLGTVYYFLL